MRYLVRSVGEREHWLPELRAAIPQLEVVQDRTRQAMDTFLIALLESGDDAAVHLEDDALLTSDFTAKVEAVIAKRPQRVINLFSRRKADATAGSRAMGGRDFSFTICFYLPPGYAAGLYDYFPNWPGRTIHRTGTDTIIADWLGSRRESYWLHVPSLVQHRPSLSAINPRRSRARQSESFVA